MRTKGMTQCALLEKELSLDDTARASLLAEARSRFNYEELLATEGTGWRPG